MTKRERKYLTIKKERNLWLAKFNTYLANEFKGLIPEVNFYVCSDKPIDFGPYRPVHVFDLKKEE